MSADLNPPRRILALDLGQARIGVAVSDLLGWTAQPLEVIQTRRPPVAIARIKKLVEEYEAGTVLLGMPYNMDGTEGPQAQWVRQFGTRLARAVKRVEIVYWDERLTTVESDQLLMEWGMNNKKRKARRDKIAAALILKSFLESRESQSGRRGGGGSGT